MGTKLKIDWKELINNSPNLRKNNYFFSSLFNTSGVDFVSEIELDDLVKGFKTLGSHLVSDFYTGSNQTIKDALRLPILQTLSWFPLHFLKELVEEATKDELIESLPNLLVKENQISLTTYMKMIIKLGDHEEALTKIYTNSKNEKIKKAVLKKLPSPTIALSDPDISLRNRAKKKLGFKVKAPVNYWERIRKAVYETLVECDPIGKWDYQKFTTSIACPTAHSNYGYNSYYKRNFEIGFRKYIPYNKDDQNPNSLSFDLRLYSTENNSVLKFENEIKKILPNSLKKDKDHMIFSFSKEDYQEIVNWIKDSFKTMIKTSLTNQFK